MSGVLVNGLISQEWEVHILPHVLAAKAGVRGSGLHPVENHPSCVSRNVADKGASPNFQGLLCTEALERLPGGRAAPSSWCGCPLTPYPRHASLLSARRLGHPVSRSLSSVAPITLLLRGRKPGRPDPRLCAPPQRERHHPRARSHVLRGAQCFRADSSARTETQRQERPRHRGE